MKRISFVALTLATMLLCISCLAGCSPNNAQPQSSNSAASSSADASNSTISTAMVAYANDDNYLFIDQETETPYIPTIPDDGVYDEQGQPISEDDLAVGNIVEVTGGLYINMGTLMPISGETITCAARRAFEVDTPWVLDPVAIGIGELRTSILREIAQYKPAIIRGNASEIIALAKLWDVDFEVDGGGGGEGPRGVDSTDSVGAARDAACTLARFTGGAVAVSGEVDLITNGNIVAFSQGGSVLMEKVTGFGCSLGGVMAVYAASAEPFVAALASANLYNLAGTCAEGVSSSPASFKVAFLDALYNATPEQIAAVSFECEAVV